MLNNIDSIDRENTLDALNAAINALDRAGDFGNGDALFELITALKSEWGIEDDD